MDIIFNTARRYTSEGQVIRAVYDETEGKVHFADFSRCVDGSFPLDKRELVTPIQFARLVMSRYDSSDYHKSLESWQLLMITGRGDATIQQWRF